MIHILDGQNDEILDYITLDNVISDTHRKSLEDTLETYDVIVLGNKEYVEHLAKRNRIIIPDEDETLRELIIYEVDRYRDSEGQKAHFYSHASYLELKKASIIYPNKYIGTASQHMGRNLNDTGWQAGIVEVAGNKTIEVENHTNPYEMLRKIAKEFGGELRFRIEHDGQKITGRYVDLLVRIGQWRGKEVTLGKDLDTIRRVEKQDIVTALLGLGPEKEDGTRLTVLVEDKDALQRWGRVDPVTGKLKHLIEPYEIQSERTEMTEAEARQYTRTALDKRINTQVTYETTIIDLADVAGLEHEEMFFGDTIRIKDTDFIPPLYLEARIFEMDRSLKQKAKKDIKLGDYIEYTEEEVNAIWEQLRKELQDRLARMVIATVISSGGDVFKNGTGSTALTAKTFVAGNEADEDGVTYDYQWIKLDKNGEQVDGFIETGKTITVNANDIDEKATYRVLIAYGLDVVTTSEYTLTHLYDGQDGEDGKDGKSSYTHVRYSQNANGSGMTTNPVNAVYIGIAITESPTAPTSASAYDWSKMRGDDGVGTPGADGKTSYVHIKYSNDGGTTFTGNNGENPGDYIGTYTDFTQADSNNVNDYTWVKVKGEKGEDGKDGPQGIPGEKGEDGKTYYTWVKYANTPTSGMSDNPSGKDYIGIAYNKESPTMSTKYSDYTWSLFKGPQGVQGQPGADGEPTYTWVKYADTENGAGMSDSPKDKLYIGLAFNKKTATESNNASDYTWSLMPQNIEIGGRNLVTLSNVTRSHATVDGYKYTLTKTSSSGNPYVRVSDEIFEDSTEYVVTFKVRKVSGNVNYMGGHSTVADHSTVKIYLDGELVTEGGSGWSNNDGKSVYPNDNEIHQYMIKFRTKNDISTDSNARWYIQPNRFNYGDNFVIEIWDWQLEKGNKATDWTPAPEDVQAEIDEAKQEAEEAKQSAQQAQTTADGKNSVFTQSTAPSIEGRKIGDVWFDTSRDNLMHRFNGQQWVEAKWGEQSIVANSITANHIKSLVGLNVNDQFIVDNQGNVEFGGHLQGASGTFGEVTAEDDNFYLEDPETGTKSYAIFKNNLFKDHSFENVGIGNILDTGRQIYLAVDRSPNEVSGWTFVGEPRVMNRYEEPYGTSQVMFGYQSLIVSSSHQAYQVVKLAPGTTVTVSLHAKQVQGWNAGIPRVRIENVSESNTVLSSHVEDFDAVTLDTKRYSFTYTVPNNSNIFFTRIYFLSANTYWIILDGVQCVESPYPSQYTPEESIADLINGNIRAHILHSSKFEAEEIAFRHPSSVVFDQYGNIGGRISATPGAYWNIKDYQGTVIFRVYLGSDRKNSDNGVQVNAGMVFNVTSGRIRNQSTYDTTTGAAANMYVATNGFYARSTSARKYKMLEEPITVDPYKLLELQPKTWFDKPQVEKFAEELTKEYQGKDTDFESLMTTKIKRIPGLVAEDVEEVGLEQFVTYDEEGNIEGLQYDRLWTLLIPIVRDLKEENERLKDDITDLIKRVEKLENAE